MCRDAKPDASLRLPPRDLGVFLCLEPPHTRRWAPRSGLCPGFGSCPLRAGCPAAGPSSARPLLRARHLLRSSYQNPLQLPDLTCDGRFL